MEGEKRMEELRLRDGLRELGEGVGYVNGRRFRVGKKGREAEQADGARLSRGKDEG